jgi:hypothetical protein
MCPDLAKAALSLIGDDLKRRRFSTAVCMVVADRKFESLVFADYEQLDQLEILSRPISNEFGPNIDGKNVLAVLSRALKPGKKYDKKVHGKELIKGLRYAEPAVVSHSRCLRKLIKELT